ncbi:MAG: OmpA family protein [Saprospiraceae bacterium]|nr:OmpA family protein [Saprospiraceae bacterium]
MPKQFEQSLNQLDKLLTKAPNFIDAYLLKAQVAYELNQLDVAKASYLKVVDLDDRYYPNLFYQLAVTTWKLDDFEATIDYCKAFLQTHPRSASLIKQTERYLENAQFAAQAIKNPLRFEPQPMPFGTVNTDELEYLPYIAADQKKLVFTRRINGQEDFYLSEKINGTWQTAQPISPINTPQNEGSLTISTDGKTWIFGASGRADTEGGYDLYLSQWRGSTFLPPLNMGKNINTSYRERQPTLSNDGKMLLFESNRPGGLGGSDIWVSYRQTNDTWSKAQNLGAPINTAEDDESPFLHPDGKTLYFMSKGHPGMGGFDLYKSEWQTDGTWGKPMNLGYPINTKSDEGAIVVTLDGTTAYFTSSQREGRGTDIFYFDIPIAARPTPVTYVRATIKDATTKMPIPQAQAAFVNLKTQQTHLAIQADTEGEFLVVLPIGDDFSLNVRSDGYLFYSAYFALAESSTLDAPFELKILLYAIAEEATEIVVNPPIVLKNIFFAINSAQLLPESFTELAQLYDLLIAQPQLSIQINGHTDNVGNEKDNLILSEARAKAVYAFLLAKGIAEKRLRYKGFGETKPIDTNDSEAGRRNNRRTEFEVIKE